VINEVAAIIKKAVTITTEKPEISPVIIRKIA